MHARTRPTRARTWLEQETPVSDDASLLKLQDQAAGYIREAKRRDPSESDELISTVLDAVARDYFRHAIAKQKKCARRVP